MPPRLSLATARAIWIAAQELGGTGDHASLRAVVERTGFVRTLGGAEAYVALRARRPATTRAEVDRAVARGEVRVVPAVRGCMYLVGRAHVGLALRLAAWQGRATAVRELAEAGATARDLGRVGDAIARALRAGPMTTDALRRAGVGAPLPLALRRLEQDGRVERTPEGGRLDGERYRWRLVDGLPAGPRDPAAGARALAALYLGAVRLGSAAALAAWGGLGVREARAALEAAGGLPIAVDGLPGEWLMAPRPPDGDPAAIGLLPFADNLVALLGGPGPMVDAAHHGLGVPRWGAGRLEPLGRARALGLRGVVAEGRLAGFWEWDPDARAVVWGALGAVAPATRRRVDGAAARLGAFLAGELGHGRWFALDTDDDLRRRAAFVRRLGAVDRRRGSGKIAAPWPTSSSRSSSRSATTRRRTASSPATTSRRSRPAAGASSRSSRRR